MSRGGVDKAPAPTKVGMIDVRWLATTGLTAALQVELEGGATCSRVC